jgi:osmotically inducible protein OsmC
MATVRTARTAWEGNLAQGKGIVTFASSGIGEFPVTWAARSEAPNGLTSPEELIAGAHSACFSMALSHALTQAGNPPSSLDTQADVTFQPGTGITGIHLTVTGDVPGLDAAGFAAAATDAKANCPVSKALAGTTITLTATLA